jgi:hypothetical protein
MALLAPALLSCGGNGESRAEHKAGPAPAAGQRADAGGNPSALDPPSGFVAKLTREVRPLSGERIAWSTEWRLCWSRYPGADYYELETLTGEGASPRLSRRGGRCLGLEVAAGENRRSEGFRLEQSQLVQSSSLLSYRVRAQLGGGRVSSWSKPFPAGEKTPNP